MFQYGKRSRGNSLQNSNADLGGLDSLSNSAWSNWGSARAVTPPPDGAFLDDGGGTPRANRTDVLLAVASTTFWVAVLVLGYAGLDGGMGLDAENFNVGYALSNSSSQVATFCCMWGSALALVALCERTGRRVVRAGAAPTALRRLRWAAGFAFVALAGAVLFVDDANGWQLKPSIWAGAFAFACLTVAGGLAAAACGPALVVGHGGHGEGRCCRCGGEDGGPARARTVLGWLTGGAAASATVALILWRARLADRRRRGGRDRGPDPTAAAFDVAEHLALALFCAATHVLPHVRVGGGARYGGGGAVHAPQAWEADVDAVHDLTPGFQPLAAPAELERLADATRVKV